jgi:hypothetical protein
VLLCFCLQIEAHKFVIESLQAIFANADHPTAPT